MLLQVAASAIACVVVLLRDVPSSCALILDALILDALLLDALILCPHPGCPCHAAVQEMHQVGIMLLQHLDSGQLLPYQHVAAGAAQHTGRSLGTAGAAQHTGSLGTAAALEAPAPYSSSATPAALGSSTSAAKVSPGRLQDGLEDQLQATSSGSHTQQGTGAAPHQPHHPHHPHQYKFGFHKPPFRSVDHLHLHCLALPHQPAAAAIKYCLPLNWLPVGRLVSELPPGDGLGSGGGGGGGGSGLLGWLSMCGGLAGRGRGQGCENSGASGTSLDQRGLTDGLLGSEVCLDVDSAADGAGRPSSDAGKA